MTTNFVIDFDSTFVTLESLDELAKISLNNNPQKEEILSKIKSFTRLGMEGKISFEESLKQRMMLLTLHTKHLEELISLLKKSISTSILENKEFFLQHRQDIYIISGGFRDFIYPVVKDFTIDESHILANTFTINEKGQITGYDETNPLSQKHGKVKAVKSLQLYGTIIVIGDGYTDFEIKEQHAADVFIAYAENVSRPEVERKADKVVSNFKQIIHDYNS